MGKEPFDSKGRARRSASAAAAVKSAPRPPGKARRRGTSASAAPSAPPARTTKRAKVAAAKANVAPATGRRSRKAREVERIRQDILDAASRAFTLRGYHATTMEQVAREAGYAVGSLYTYFPSKRELYQSLLQTITDQLEAVANRPLTGSLTLRQRFEILVAQQLELIEKNRGFLVTYLAQRPGFGVEQDDGSGAWVNDIFRRNVERAAEQAAAGMKSGELRRMAPLDVGHFMVDVIYGATLRWGAGELEGSLAAHAPVLIDLIFAGIGAPKEKRR